MTVEIYEVTIPLRAKVTTVARSADEALAFAYEYFGDKLRVVSFVDIELTDGPPEVILIQYPEDDEEEE